MRHYMRMCSLTIIIALLGLTLTPSASAVSSAIEQQVLAGEWDKLYTSLAQDSATLEDPIAAHLLAIACQATNRNHEIKLVARTIRSEGEKELWKNWTLSFLNRNTGNPYALFLAGDAASRLADTAGTETISYYSRAIEKKEDFPLALNARGLAYYLHGRKTEALTEYNRALQVDPGFADALQNRGIYYYDNAEYQKAYDDFTMALRIDSTYAMALANRAKTCYFLKDFDQGLEDVAAARKLKHFVHPDLVDALRQAAGRRVVPPPE